MFENCSHFQTFYKKHSFKKLFTLLGTFQPKIDLKKLFILLMRGQWRDGRGSKNEVLNQEVEYLAPAGLSTHTLL